MMKRRSFLNAALHASLAALFPVGTTYGCLSRNKSSSLISQIGQLNAADDNGVRLPDGFTSRIIARSRYMVINSAYRWHGGPDGGATIATPGGGWLYISNSELPDNRGGVGVIEFSKTGKIINAWSILENTNRNCAGGITPWDTWLSCEEVEKGFVWECDPFGKNDAIKRPALGVFAHEAVAVDTVNNHLYLTEDKKDGCLYRYIPSRVNTREIPDLDNGKLQLAVVDEASRVGWHDVPDPQAKKKPTRKQVPSATRFKGSEGVVYCDGKVSFSTKGDNRIWTYNTLSNTLDVIYDAAKHSHPILTGVDNIALSQDGELIVSEDGGDLQIIAISDERLIPLLQLEGHDSSEITGPAFSPDGKRLYFSSQRGTTGNMDEGMTFEVTGPFHR